MKNDGKNYEEFVRKIHTILINYDNGASIRNINIEKNKKIVDKSGIEREFDLYWEFRLGGYIYKTVIECKDYNSSISIDKIDSFIGKLNDFPNLRGIYATKTGYQKGAELKAKHHNVDLLIVRESNDSDWIDEEGQPYIRTIAIRMKAITQPSATSFGLTVDKNWLDTQSEIDEERIRTTLSIIRNDEVLIENINEDKTYSLRFIGDRIIKSNPQLPYGEGVYEEIYDNAFLLAPKVDFRIKIKAIKVHYEYLEPIESEFEIDLAEQVLGIVMNYHEGTKKTILKNGMVK
ncbi:restriction endonuclease [Atlantibacter sp.]|uniref:restriction endonuclease n=1 Tax=Atlantibacter sp. TaxID=1903473 RepID=UPI0028986AFF|nr:restriction endonuclease [Atlantibacter sp.]